MEDPNTCPSPSTAERRALRVRVTERARPLRRASRHRASTAKRAGVLASLLLLASAGAALAANPVPVQFFYNPYPETQLLAGFQSITPDAASPIQTYISIAAAANNTIIYYDQWENGYDADIANPANLYSGGNPGGTQIWGDGNPANGAPPGLPSDIINAGTVIILNNPVPIPRNPAVFLFDGSDKIAATKTIAISHVAWSTGPDTLLTDSVEVSDTSNWGTNYLAPVGGDIPDATDHQMFEFSSFAIMAGEGGATINIDKDADGVFETTATLAEGQGYFVNGGVEVGARVTSDKPVQVDLFTGDIGSSYESRDFKLLPTNLWASSSYEPVSTPASIAGTAGTGTTVYLYNPNNSNISVDYTTRSAAAGNPLTTTTLVVPGGVHGGYLPQIIPNGFGAHFESSGPSTGMPFFAVSASNSTDPSTSGNQAFNWGFTLVPEDALTSQVLIGLGIGRDPTSNVSPNEDGNPIWVTPVGNGDTPVTVYVDFDGNPLTGANTDPNGNKYDLALSLRELERDRIYDTTDNDQTGTLVYTLTPGVKLAAAWGQDPLTASPGAPGLDAGTGIPPLPLFSAGKLGTLDTDADGDGFISPGDVILYTISISNISRAPVPDLRLTDTLPVDTIYVPGSTFFKNSFNVTTPIPDDGSGTAFPLDGTGVVLDPISALPVGGSYQVTFKVTIKSFANLTPGVSNIVNTCAATSGSTTMKCQDTTPLYGRIGDFVWNDIDGDAVQDGGAEVGIPNVTVNLYIDLNGNGIVDGGDSIVGTKVTDANGGYLFIGVPAGKYVVDVVNATVPAGFVLTTANDPTAVNLAGGEWRLNVDFGYRGLCITVGGQPVVCTASDQCHVAGVCDPQTGQCSNPVANNGSSCSDGNACTQTDTCQGGVCGGSNPVTCSAQGQCHVAGTCDPQTGQCSSPNAPNGTSCSDGNLCTQTDTCQGGICGGSNPVTCGAPGICHVQGTCDPNTGQCSNPIANNGTSCSDGNACTQSDTCQAGSCTGSNPVTCPAPGVCHVQGTCDPANGQCSNPTAPNGTTCSDSNACTQTDVCQAGACAGTNLVTCPAPGQCHLPGTCNPANGQCSNPIANNGTSCSDGNACTQTDTCQAGSCSGANPVTCPVPGLCHLPGACDPQTGSCSNPTAPDGTVCDDGSTCSTGDQCVAGMCQGVATGCEICDDQIDNNGDGLIDCLDPQCPACPPIIDTCHHPCVSQIINQNRGLDLLRLQASFKPVTSTDPATEQFGVLITDINGVVFKSLLPPGTVKRLGRTFVATVKNAKTVGGIYKVKIIVLADGSYRINVKGYGEMTAKANVPNMTVQVLIGNDVSISATTWTQIKVGWRAQLP